MHFDDNLSRVSQFLTAIHSDDMTSVLEDVMTPQEIVELGERLQLLKRLQSGQTQREIAREMGVSVTTVSRGSRVLQFGKQIIKKYL